MRLRPLVVLGTVVALFLVSGCTPEPEPTPKPSTSPSASATPTPTPDPIVAPDAAFDVTCDDVAAEMAALVGEPATPMEPVLSIVSAPGWLPGPAQHMFQRAGGIACSAGDASRSWEVSIVPDAQAVTAGATERQGWWGEQAGCGEGRCGAEIVDGDVLLSAIVADPGLTEADAARTEEAFRRLLGAAASSLRAVEYVDSALVGAPCERYITAEEVSEIVGEESVLFTDFGGWGIPAEVYQVVNGSRICYYTSAEGDLETISSHLMVTTLPAGAWAFETLGGTPAQVEGADAAKESSGAYGERILDLRVGLDWIRVETYDNGSGAGDPLPAAETVVRNLTVGRPAPQ